MRAQEYASLDRNLDSLVQELAAKCGAVFKEASGAFARAVVVDRVAESGDEDGDGKRRRARVVWTRERCVAPAAAADAVAQYVAVGVERADRRFGGCLHES